MKYIYLLYQGDIYKREVVIGVYQHNADAYAMKSELDKYTDLTNPYGGVGYTVRAYPLIDQRSADTSLRNQRQANKEIEEEYG